MSQSRFNPLKKGRMSGHPSPIVGLVTQKARIHTELQIEQSALFCLQNPISCFLVIVLLEASIFLCISEDCDFQSSLGKDGVGMEKQVVVHCGLADLSLWTKSTDRVLVIVFSELIADHEFRWFVLSENQLVPIPQAVTLVPQCPIEV